MMTGLPASNRNCLARSPPSRVPRPAAAMMATFIKAESRIQNPGVRIKTKAVESLLFWLLDSDSWILPLPFIGDALGRGAYVAHGPAACAVHALLGAAVLARLLPEAAEDHLAGRRLKDARDGDVGVAADELSRVVHH